MALFLVAAFATSLLVAMLIFSRPAQFWLLHAAIAAAGGVVIMIFGRMLERALADRGEPCT